MTHAWTYETAASYWSANRDNPEPVWDAFESAEEFLLDHAPGTSEEAVRMIEVLVEQGGDRRTDGRDVDALERVQEFLRLLASQGPAQAVADVAPTPINGRHASAAAPPA